MRGAGDWLHVCPSCGFEKSTLEPGAGRGVGGLEVLRRQNFATMIQKISDHIFVEGKTCLEVGCAEGWFLEAMEKKGARLQALEPSEMANELIDKGYDTIKGFFPEAVPADREFDLIVFNDVFEHIPAPVEAIKACEALLKDDGIVVINLPSNAGFFYRVSKLLHKVGMTTPLERMWQVGLPSPHLSYFSPVTLQRFVEKHTALEEIDVFSLPSIVHSGLKERIRGTYKGLVGNIVYAGVLCAIPVIRMLPQDISVLFFKKGKVGY